MQKDPSEKIDDPATPRYVFISYARPDADLAAQVERFLTANGIRTFRDVTGIPSGPKWDQTIGRALKECDRMVLLLSKASMTERDEVHAEWGRFLELKKTIHPLLLEECEVHYRISLINRIDARPSLPDALARLLNDLRAGGPSAEPDPLRALLDRVRSSDGHPALSIAEAEAIRDRRPVTLEEFRLGRIAEWSLPRHHLDKRFVNLTMILDRGETEQQRWQRAEAGRFNDLRDVLAETPNDPVLVLLGAPGSGKSTLLRRLQLDHSADRLRDGTEGASFFIQLNGYRARTDGPLPEPREWLCARWAALYPALPRLERYLERGGNLLLLDALNEMPHRSTADYHRLVDLWRAFAQEAAGQRNRVVFSCRSLDYSASLSGPDLRVPQVEIQPMDRDQVREFLRAYTGEHEERIWKELDGTPQFTLYQTPYFLKLLGEQVDLEGDVPRGRAALFTGFVRQALRRECRGKLFQLDAGLLVERDHEKLSLGRWSTPFELPERGPLLPKLSELAHTMQLRGLETEGAQVRIDYDDACEQLAHERAEEILKAGISLNVLDKDVAEFEISFFHQLLQEYFAARRLAREPKPELVHVEWSADAVRPPLAETLAGLADGDPLPPLPQTGWEETTLTAAPMAKDPERFLRDLLPHNLPLAARCAASPETRAGEPLKAEIRRLLLARTQDMTADLRARIAAGEALGLLGDPRFVRKTGPHGDYLLPPLVAIPGGTWPMGVDQSDYDFEKPAHTVELAPFQLGQFPVTNAEYRLFIEAGGYEDERWWDTQESIDWLSGKGSSEGPKQQLRDNRKTVQGWSEDFIRDLVKQNRWTTKEAEDWIGYRNMPDEEWEQLLENSYPDGMKYREPGFWNDARFNNPSQPVVGVTWFEARAYCNWLTANSGGEMIYRLPTEAEFEAAARGGEGRMFPYGEKFDSARSNTFESHIRRTTPVGVFDNATPEGAYDLSGNAYTWTLSIYDQENFRYPYRPNDGREEIHQAGLKRVLRGGSWFLDYVDARAVFRVNLPPAVRGSYYGFRLFCVVRPPSS